MVVTLIVKVVVPVSTRKLYCCSLIFTDSSHNCLLSGIVSLRVASLGRFWIIFLLLNQYDTLNHPLALLLEIFLSIGIENQGLFSTVLKMFNFTLEIV